ncbi:MAG: alanine racemase, partial [Candidatus Omnitrophica bacterium]|nr:alanine racemase [Candidatus Omnitrophota bacterium]
MNFVLSRPLWIEINLDNLVYNFEQIKKRLSCRTKIMAIVKKDAYGHGMVEVSKVLSSLGVDYLGVACIDEAIKLRRENIKLPILILGGILEENLRSLENLDLSFSISRLDLAEKLNSLAKKSKNKIRVHIKIDTGMSRLGVLYYKAYDFVKKVSKFSHLHIEGIFTHLACADKNREFTLLQIERFRRLTEKLKKNSIEIPLIHCANSIG